MNGKVLKILNNDLYGNVDDRKVAVFAAFEHLKYMNKYVIFTFEGEYEKNILYYGSVHLKNNSLVIFQVNDNVKPYIDKFVNDYINNTLNLSEYSIINIANINKVELVSYNQAPFNYLNVLDQISIPKIVSNTLEETTSKRNTILYILLFIMIALLIGISYLYFFPEKFMKELNELTCSANNYHNSLAMKYNTVKTIKFDEANQIKVIDVIETYTFNNQDDYIQFKDNNEEKEYFDDNSDYKYDDEKLTLEVIYQETSVIESYDEVKKYFKKEGYTCQEGKYYE